jgi:hypothetical protein
MREKRLIAWLLWVRTNSERGSDQRERAQRFNSSAASAGDSFPIWTAKEMASTILSPFVAISDHLLPFLTHCCHFWSYEHRPSLVPA